MNRLSESRRLGKRFGDSFFLSRKLNTLNWMLNRAKEARKLVREILQKDKPDYIAVGRWWEPAHFWCSACQNLKLPYILFAYGLELIEPLSKRMSRARELDFCSAQKIISISRATTSELKKLGVDESKIIIVQPGINPQKMQPLSEDILQRILADLSLRDARYILGIGRLVKRKGFDLAIRAFANVAKDFPNISLVIVGDGPEMEDLKRIADEINLRKCICFPGKVTNEQKIALFQKCEFFVMPNRPVQGDMEGFGIVFLEAGIFGKAVIGGNNGGVPDAVVDGQTGILVDTLDSATPLANAMRCLLNNPSLSRQMGENGRLRAINDFDWKKISAIFIKKIFN
jgi:phosphatidylinositol alpha-1,6-mannosyltransferase